MPLKQYQAKRSFKNTPEPSGEPSSKSRKVSELTSKDSADHVLSFVVQKHQASHLHYDFRLELNGVLLSWAVPKGPSNSPKDKRLAMHVEDHPLDYADFEGIIPEGNYGAGTVMVWDSGTYAPIGAAGNASTESASKETFEEMQKQLLEQYRKGDMKFALHGKKLKGEFALVRIKDRKSTTSKPDKTWLLIKHNDNWAGKKIDNADLSVKTGRTLEEITAGASPRALQWTEVQKLEAAPVASSFPAKGVKPMLATLVDDLPIGSDWLYELKWDGYRCLAEVKGGEVRLYSRNGLDLTDRYAAITSHLQSTLATRKIDLLIDGELVVVNEAGIPKFEYLQEYGNNSERQIIYYSFDLLYLDKFDLRELPLAERRKYLEQLIDKKSGYIQISKQYTDGKSLLSQAKKLGFEGIIAKKKDAPYLSERSSYWLKVKLIQEEEFIVCGYTFPKNNREAFGSLLLGEYRAGNSGNELKYVGLVGTGFSSSSLQGLQKQLDNLSRETSPFTDTSLIDTRTVAHWVSPKLVVQVGYAERTKNNLLRQAKFNGIREDKTAKEVVVQPRAHLEEKTASGQLNRIVTYTNTDKVYWPELGLTKKDLLDYYEKVGDVMLPYLINRPQNMNRHPNGIYGESFYQKDFDQAHPSWLETFEIYSDSADRVVNYVVVNNVESLLYLANLGCIEINAWNSRVASLDQPDYLIFDLDPAQLGFEKVVAVANRLHELLKSLKLPNYCKTSGKRGLHVFVPLNAPYNFEQARMFSKLIALEIAAQLPEVISLEHAVADRQGKIYIDYLQNRRGQTTASVYAARPTVHATISAPLDWSEVNKSLKPEKFTIKNFPRRLNSVGDLWKGVLNEKADLLAALDQLSRTKPA